jgi:hypothetical protein
VRETASCIRSDGLRNTPVTPRGEFQSRKKKLENVSPEGSDRRRSSASRAVHSRYSSLAVDRGFLHWIMRHQ